MFLDMLRSFGARSVANWRISLRNLFITTEVTPNPNALKFMPGRDVLGSGKTCDFPHIRDAYKVSIVSDLEYWSKSGSRMSLNFCVFSPRWQSESSRLME